MRVAMLEKMRGGLKKNKFFFMDFSSKIDWKSIEKSRKTTFAAKIDEKALPGTAFLGKCRFLLIFGIPGGTQKLLKIYESFRVKGSWEPSGSHFGRFNAFFWFWLHFWCILAPFWVPRARFLVNFCKKKAPNHVLKFNTWFDQQDRLFFPSRLGLFCVVHPLIFVSSSSFCCLLFLWWVLFVAFLFARTMC